MHADYNPQSTSALPLDESVQIAHAAAKRIGNLLDALWADITGEPYGADPACAPAPTAGLARDTQRLGDLLHGSADRLEAIRSRVVARNVVGMATIGGNGGGGGGGARNF